MLIDAWKFMDIYNIPVNFIHYNSKVNNYKIIKNTF